MLLKVSLVLILSIAACQAKDKDERPIVKTPLGKIQGYPKESFEKKPFSAFEGIPYAKAPLGNLRFREPIPVEPWVGVWDAIHVSQCLQTGMVQPELAEGEEDCLHINVYVPRSKPDPKEKLDVIVHIHGGAFMFGSGHTYSHPEYFMDHDVIFVTFNYRLGILGFLSTQDEVVPGNNGLKDQVLALKWIQQNIAYFGGNPQSVTLTGLSAGAASVHLHYLSPMSKGLFHKGFAQSAVALNPWVIQEEPLAKAQLLADSVGCPVEPTKELVECLRQRSFKHILTKVPLFYGFMFAPVSPMAPVVEKGPKAFLSEEPYSLLKKGQVQDVPFLASNSADEGLFPAMFLHKNLEYVDREWDNIAPYLLDYNYTLPKKLWKDASQKSKEFYLGKDQKISKKSYDNFIKLFSDRLFLVDADEALRLHSKATKSPVYYYSFGYTGDHNENKTVSHGEDSQYFYYKMFSREHTKNELKMVKVVMNMLVTFAKTGKPEFEGVAWDPVKFDDFKVLNITGYEAKDMELKSVKELGAKDFWKSLNLRENQNLGAVKDEL